MRKMTAPAPSASTQRINVETPNSSTLARWTYNPRTQALTVTFVAGNSFRYRGVPSEVAAQLRRTRGSVGRAFNRLIKSTYSGSRCSVRPAA